MSLWFTISLPTPPASEFNEYESKKMENDIEFSRYGIVKPPFSFQTNRKINPKKFGISPRISIIFRIVNVSLLRVNDPSIQS
jgi:hypothetical protein